MCIYVLHVDSADLWDESLRHHVSGDDDFPVYLATASYILASSIGSKALHYRTRHLSEEALEVT
jgi:hypothetical protein